MKNLIRVLFLVFIASDALAHAILVFPSPRSPRDDLKTGPCGGIAKGSPATTLQARSEIEVRWSETINHSGYFFIDFAPSNDTGFSQYVLANPIPDDKNGGAFSYTVRVPDMTCNNCTLRLVQFMENSAQPYYFSCADIKIEDLSSKPDVGIASNKTDAVIERPGFGCGTVVNKPKGSNGISFLFLIAPLFMIFYFRNRLLILRLRNAKIF